MAEYPALPLWTDAYLADTTHLSDAEHGRYCLMLFHMWRCPARRFPNDDAWMARKLGKTVEQIEADYRPLIREFFKSNGNAIWHGRLEREWQKLSGKKAAASARAKRRWDKESPPPKNDSLHKPSSEKDSSSVPDKPLPGNVSPPCDTAHAPARVPQPYHLTLSPVLPSESNVVNPESHLEGGVGETSEQPMPLPSPQAAPAGPSKDPSTKPEPNGHDPPRANPRGSRLDPNWRPGDEGTAYAMAELGNDAVLVNETWNYFRDYWLAKAGPAARKADWPRTWKTWVRKTRDELRERHAREARYRNGRTAR